jgi:hypothetical protein
MIWDIAQDISTGPVRKIATATIVRVTLHFIVLLMQNALVGAPVTIPEGVQLMVIAQDMARVI